VVLDVDDEELAFRPAISLRHPLRLASSLSHPNGRFWTQRAIARARHADAVTVASTGLQARFGGAIVPHAKDTSRLRPGVVDRVAARHALGLGDERVVMFMGTPRAFKGIEDVAAAMRLMRNAARFVVVGADRSDPYAATLMRDWPELRFLPPYSLDEVPSLLEAADAVVVPQRLRPETVHQQPSKLLDAMALAKPIVATGVADIPDILAQGRGHVVPPADPAALALALDAIFDDPAGAAHMGKLARQWCVAQASYDAVRPVLANAIGIALARR
jgi:glycosyltransferase involved in cell wall biosynthesis